VDVEARVERPDIRGAAAHTTVILLDTHALIWLAQGHRRARQLARHQRLHLSPATILEIQFLAEAGRLRFAAGHSATALSFDSRWRIDAPPADKWFSAACELTWTRDPFDRLLAAHAALRGWKLATADDVLIGRLPSSAILAL
jgi:PIN domain nuclease of toxin-antitoxin system